MAITLDGSNGIGTPDLESTGPITGTTGTFSGNVTANGLSTELRPLVLGTAQASTSGTTVDFTGIPSWVKRVTVSFSGVSLSGSSIIEIRLGDAGGIEATGYLGNSAQCANGNFVNGVNNSTGFSQMGAGQATAVLHGSFIMTLIAGNTWAGTGSLARSDANGINVSGGVKTLSDTLTQVRITTLNGTDTFDAGTINIMYE